MSRTPMMRRIDTSAARVSLLATFSVRRGERLVAGLDDKHGQKAGGRGIASVFAHQMVRSWLFIEALASPINSSRLGTNSASDFAGEYISVYEGGAGMVMRPRPCSRRVIHEHCDQFSVRQVRDRATEDRLYALRRTIGHRRSDRCVERRSRKWHLG